ncbi:diguanylate cyclase [Arcobacter sp. LA11]|uniref:diguanylate cyclase n=1 Tax=Arcobacter sp. LA11 TaxID=1898176 RepID=UPI000934E8A1|nr:diguanylate cyclase [Arcobacter sp. LA11]
MDKIILEKLIYKNYLKTALTSILFIEITLIVIYFNVNNSMVNKSVDFILNDIKKSLSTIVQNATFEIEHKFNDIENLTYILQNEHQNFFKHYKEITLEKKPNFDYAKNGMYYKSIDNGGSSVVVSKNTAITNDIQKKLINSEVFDNTFKSIVDGHDMVIAAYFNSHDNFNRYYPYLPNAYNIFPADLTMKNYNFYYKANALNNPEKKMVWTDVYLDPAGQGWMLSAIAPIYNKGFLEGVTGIDVTVEMIINKFLNFKLPYNGKSFLIDDKGNLIAMPKEIASIFKIKDLDRYIYNSDEKITKTVYKKSDYSILEYENKDVVKTIRNVINDLPHSNDLIIGDNKYLLFTEKIERTSWYVISMINEKEIISEVRALENHYVNLGYVIIASIITFYLLFFIYLYTKAKQFVRIINEPLSKIISLTKNLGLKKDISKLEECGIVEIDILNENFNNLALELDERTKKLVKSETQRVFNEKLANTDSLTGVYNRRFLEDFSEKYMKIVRREEDKLSMLLIDIDDFKIKNDTYGHNTGDLIIKKLVSIIKNIIRDDDLIIRYGGDEFIVLLPSTNINNARKVGKKLVSYLNEVNQLESKELFFTITIGTSEYESSDRNIEDIIHRADKSLYKAKDLGKNCVV